jgi:hypothetical protein
MVQYCTDVNCKAKCTRIRTYVDVYEDIYLINNYGTVASLCDKNLTSEGPCCTSFCSDAVVLSVLSVCSVLSVLPVLSVLSPSSSPGSPSTWLRYMARYWPRST